MATLPQGERERSANSLVKRKPQAEAILHPHAAGCLLAIMASGRRYARTIEKVADQLSITSENLNKL